MTYSIPHSNIEPFVATATLTTALIHSPTGRLDYMTFLGSLFPDAFLKGQRDAKVCSEILDSIFDHCVNNGLPILSALVSYEKSEKDEQEVDALIKAAKRNKIYIGIKGEESFVDKIEAEAEEWINYQKTFLAKASSVTYLAF